MDFLTKLNLKTSNILKISGLVLLALIVVVVAFRLIGSSFNSVFPHGVTIIESEGAPAAPSMSSYDYTYESGSAMKSSAQYSVGLSTRNAGATGDESEEYEVTQYSATIETRELNETCSAVSSLKAYDYVIFENANEYNRGCNYVFKVKKDKAEEILTVIKDLNPKELSDNTYTIKGLIDDFTGEIEILQKKLSSIDETLEKAIEAYDDITALATRVQDVESLAKIIDSKINIIERLTQERINVNSQLERLERSKADQLDRLGYTYFSINIVENKFIDGQNLKDSWKQAVKEFVRDINNVVQDVTINLVALLFFALQYAVYFFILLVIVKYGWQLVKYIWKK